jgi:hypothetical protein
MIAVMMTMEKKEPSLEAAISKDVATHVANMVTRQPIVAVEELAIKRRAVLVVLTVK